ncbi:MAG: methylmalonyl Co-A mutase-associated GTPase MeaB [Balneolaceae bacterium]|nr:methylmalonyl Co-A mutase-associated GTPase MeaB [Balneolaceae bacterium]
MKSSDSINRSGAGRLKERQSELSVDQFVEGILDGDRTVLSRAITLIESTRPEHREQAQEIIDRTLSETGDSIRIAITGVPGVGKSTFIEALGNYIIDQGRKLTVLAIDPSSVRSKGSILGDKTRMESLANNPDAYIRPSPTAGSLGGVARKTREAILLCEAAGYDTIFIETVGVGQSETAAHSMVDFFLLLMLAGAGDELQGIKRGIVEMADMIAINKIDALDKQQVEKAVGEYRRALQLYPEPDSGWGPKVTTCSAREETNIDEIWNQICDYIEHTRENGYFAERRNRQARHWMYETIDQELKSRFYNHPEIKKHLRRMEQKVQEGEISSTRAARQILQRYRQDD